MSSRCSNSWAGSLSADDYSRLVAPWSRRILDAVRAAGAPVIHFAAFGANLLEALADGADVVGVDPTQSLGSARARLGQRAVQGNLDPARLSGSWTDVTAAVTAVIKDNGGLPGHIFNTGHAIPRDTDPSRLVDIVSLVHDLTSTAVTPVGATA